MVETIFKRGMLHMRSFRCNILISHLIKSKRVIKTNKILQWGMLPRRRRRINLLFSHLVVSNKRRRVKGRICKVKLDYRRERMLWITSGSGVTGAHIKLGDFRSEDQGRRSESEWEEVEEGCVVCLFEFP